MHQSIRGRVATRSLVVASALLLAATGANAAGPRWAAAGPGPDYVRTGPSSSQTPYYEPFARGVDIKSLLTAGDAVDGYRMAGIPDGLGAYRSGNDTFTVLMNHEIPAGLGGPHAHAPNGAFISKWRIQRDDHEVVDGGDLIQSVATYDTTTDEYNAPAYGVVLSRFCSADLARKRAFHDAASGLGFDGRIYLTGEEIGAEGRAFGTVVKGADEGVAYELPALGKMSFENVVANAWSGVATVVIGLDDATPGQVYVYVGEKSSTGNPVEQAGLTGGTLYGIAVDGVVLEDRAAGIGGPSKAFSLASLGDVTEMTGAQLETASDTAGVTEFLRPEDGAWDPSAPNDFYFVTTDRFNTVKRPGTAPTINTPAAQEGATRLWRLSFDDRTQPELGGIITELIDGSTGGDRPQMFDNMTIDTTGRILLTEDPGGQPYVAKIWEYDIATDHIRLIARSDNDRFGNDAGKPPVAPFSTDEESSGIIDASRVLGPGWFLFDVQAHYPNADPTLYEGGQLLMMRIP
ncbi:MAG: DUF839 domain-containing protein [Chloroflexi bacterium]|nr:DUF839 domain-containing protein [Chloroflexota bacterium]